MSRMNKFISRLHPLHFPQLLTTPIGKHLQKLNGHHCKICLQRRFGTGIQDTPAPIYFRAENYLEKVAIIDQSGKFKYKDLLHYGKLLSDDLVQIVIANQSENNEEFRDKDVCLESTIETKRIAFLCENDVSYVIAQWATWMAGGVAVPLCTTHPKSELEYVIQNSQCSVIVASKKFFEKIKPISSELNIPLKVLSQSDYTCNYDQNAWFSDAKSIENKKDLVKANWYRNQPCMMIYTSGTTGRPKASNYHNKLNFGTDYFLLKGEGDWDVELKKSNLAAARLKKKKI